jgi:uncharacterized protein YjbI with pentapeptide repeats
MIGELLSLFRVFNNEMGVNIVNADTKECPFCAETIKAKAKYCRFCGHYLEGYTQESILRNYIGGDQVDGDKSTIGDVSDTKGMAVGRESMAASTGNVEGPFIQAQGDVKLGKELRDEQYETVLNWENKGKPRMRCFDLSNRDLSGLNLTDADLKEANLQGANLEQAVLERANLQSANLNFAILQRYKKATFKGIESKRNPNTNLHHANLCYAKLKRALVVGVNLTEALLFGSDLSEADLHLADLSGADLRNANLSDVNLSGTDLSEAVLRFANLSRAKMRWVKLSGTILDRAKYTKETTWPEGFDPAAAGAILVDDEGKPIEGSE